jgi:single-strand DNA-binding protein
VEILSGYTTGEAYLIGMAIGLTFAAIAAAWFILEEGE